MSDPSNPQGDWQQVPHTPADPASQAYPPPSQGYPPTPAGSYQPPPAGYTPPPQAGYPPAPVPPQSAPMSPTSVAAISYLTFIPAIIFLVTEPYKRMPLVRFHAIQCLALTVVAVIVSIIVGVIMVPLMVTGLWFVAHLLSRLVDLAFIIIWILCIFKASKGEWFKLPIIGDFALKQAQKP
ncbi:MAG TPA: DUF4870 domain-containing protein [Acidobacteriaceae bacterium]|nr:DUF4870 domain-containing protein [Acidobacteriaceae bacterium]